jgi:hypothetical protein
LAELEATSSCDCIASASASERCDTSSVLAYSPWRKWKSARLISTQRSMWVDSASRAIPRACLERPAVARQIALQFRGGGLAQLGFGLRPRALRLHREPPRALRLGHRPIGLAEHVVNVRQARMGAGGAAAVAVVPGAFGLLLAQPEGDIVVPARRRVARQQVGGPVGERPVAEQRGQAVRLQRVLLGGAGFAGPRGELRAQQRRARAGAAGFGGRPQRVEPRRRDPHVVEAAEVDLRAAAQGQNLASLRQRAAGEIAVGGREPAQRCLGMRHHLFLEQRPRCASTSESAANSGAQPSSRPSTAACSAGRTQASAVAPGRVSAAKRRIRQCDNPNIGSKSSSFRAGTRGVLPVPLQIPVQRPCGAAGACGRPHSPLRADTPK